MIVAGGSIPEKPAHVLCALRGGPHAELALKLSLAIARTSNAQDYCAPPDFEISSTGSGRGVQRSGSSAPQPPSSRAEVRGNGQSG